MKSEYKRNKQTKTSCINVQKTTTINETYKRDIPLQPSCEHNICTRGIHLFVSTILCFNNLFSISREQQEPFVFIAVRRRKKY